MTGLLAPPVLALVIGGAQRAMRPRPAHSPLFDVRRAWSSESTFVLVMMAVTIPRSAYIVLPVVAVVVGLLSSLIALRRAVTVDPALAFGG